MFVSQRGSVVRVNGCKSVFERLDCTYGSDGEKGIVKTRPLDKRYSQEYPDQTGENYKGGAQGNSDDDICPVICVSDDGERWIVASGDM